MSKSKGSISNFKKNGATLKQNLKNEKNFKKNETTPRDKKLKNEKEKSEDIACPICLESPENVDKILKLSCVHSMCEGCAKRILKLECPICKVEICTFNEKLKKKINQNNIKYKQECVREEQNELMAQEEILLQYNDITLMIVYLCTLGIDPGHFPNIEPVDIQHLNSYTRLNTMIIIYVNTLQEMIDKFSIETFNEQYKKRLRESV